jgi:hypothetical protein
MELKYLSWGELDHANRRAIRAKCNSIDPEYVLALPKDYRYPIYFTLPYERQGWVRCHVGTGVSSTASDYVPCLLDVPQEMYDRLAIIVVEDEEVVESDLPTKATTNDVVAAIRSDAKALLAAICDYDRDNVLTVLEHLRVTLEAARCHGVSEPDIERILEEVRQSESDVDETWDEILGQVSVYVWLEDPDGNRVRGDTVTVDRICWNYDDAEDLLDDEIQRLREDLEVDWEVVGQS